MTLVRGAVVLSATEKPTSRGKIGTSGMQIYGAGGMWWSRKTTIKRNPPYTIESPHPGQMEVRINFGVVAHGHKGERKFKDGMPVVAAGVKAGHTGFRAPSKFRTKEEYPSRIHPCFHSVAELKSMLRARKEIPVPAPEMLRELR